MANFEFKEGTPARQGFYMVQTKSGQKVIGEWREFDKAEGKRWWTYTSDDPTVQKTRVALADVVRFAKVGESQVTAFLTRERTREERIEGSYHFYVKNRSATPAVRMPVPEQRRLVVGQEVSIDHLRNPVVVALHDDGEVVTVEHRSTKVVHGIELDLGPEFSTRYWLEVLPKVETLVDPLPQDIERSTRLTQSFHGTMLNLLVKRMYQEGVYDNPEYQRGYVWTSEDEQMYLDSLFSNRDVGRFIFVIENNPCRISLLDGKQRMHTLLRLQASLIPYRGVYWHQMTWERRHNAFQRVVQFADLEAEKFKKSELLRIFLDVNIGGVPQTREHVTNVQSLLEAELAKEAAAVK